MVEFTIEGVCDRDSSEQRREEWLELSGSNPQRRPTLVIYSQQAPLLTGLTA